MTDEKSQSAKPNRNPQKKKSEGGNLLSGKEGRRRGRPPGSRNKLGEVFISELHASFLKHGPEVIEKLRVEDPKAYINAIAKIIPKDLNLSVTPMADYTEQNLTVLNVTINQTIELLQSGKLNPDDLDIDALEQAAKMIEHE